MAHEKPRATRLVARFFRISLEDLNRRVQGAYEHRWGLLALWRDVLPQGSLFLPDIPNELECMRQLILLIEAFLPTDSQLFDETLHPVTLKTIPFTYHG